MKKIILIVSIMCAPAFAMDDTWWGMDTDAQIASAIGDSISEAYDSLSGTPTSTSDMEAPSPAPEAIDSAPEK